MENKGLTYHLHVHVTRIHDQVYSYIKHQFMKSFVGKKTQPWINMITVGIECISFQNLEYSEYMSSYLTNKILNFLS